MALGALQMTEGNNATPEEFLVMMQARYASAVLASCYSEMTPAEFTLVQVPSSLEDCDTDAAEAAQDLAAFSLDMDARRAAYNLMLFALAEPSADCDGAM